MTTASIIAAARRIAAAHGNTTDQVVIEILAGMVLELAGSTSAGHMRLTPEERADLMGEKK